MRPIGRAIAMAGIVAAVTGGGMTAASAQPVGTQSEGEVSCGYVYDACVRQWYDYGFVKNYIVGEIYYRGGGYYFYWWN
ncbi:hypothetical protein ACFVWG_20555 [Kribbella sp. NPDC058245]|uniref:hypothetical protein n=1 Tax=Kribbella sp. NPDC058245 TaxID=3346399 RepID=UPI0036EB6BDE